MTRFAAIALVVALQFAFIILTLALLLVTRFRGNRARARDDDAGGRVAEPLRRIMLGDDHGEALAAALSRLHPDVARRELLSIGGTRLSLEQRAGLAKLVRRSSWVEDTLADAASGTWWKRMRAARLLVMVCDENDESLVAGLVTDPYPAVAGAATPAASSCASPALIDAIVSSLPDRPPAVRLRQCIALRSHWKLATAAVVERLRGPAAADELRAWAQLAEVLATPDAVTAVVPLSTHEDMDVRVGAARALRYCFSAEGAEAATRLLEDEEWRVRAAAARAVGALNVTGAIPLLRHSMHDESWWVRFRAGLALADLSHEGRMALAAVRDSADPFARDMAALVSGLSDGSRLELTFA